MTSTARSPLAFLSPIVFGSLGTIAVGFAVYHQRVFAYNDFPFQFVVFGVLLSLLSAAVMFFPWRMLPLFALGALVLNIAADRSFTRNLVLRDADIVAWLSLAVFVSHYVLVKTGMTGNVLLRIVMRTASVCVCYLLSGMILVVCFQVSGAATYAASYGRLGSLLGVGLALGLELDSLVRGHLTKKSSEPPQQAPGLPQNTAG